MTVTTETPTTTPELPGADTTKPVTAAAADAGTAPAQNAEATGEETSSTERDEKGRFRNPARERIDELTRKHREAEREAAYWRGRATAGQQQETAPAPDPKPTPDKYDDYGAYIEALTDWKAETKAREVLDAREKATAEKSAADTRAQTFAERQEAARKGLADYDDVVASSDVPVAEHVGELLLDSEFGPQVAYHLAKHPELAEKLNSLSPTAAAREFGRLEARLGTSVSTPSPTTADPTDTPAPRDDSTATTAAPTPRTTKAPPPVKPVNQGQSAQKDPSKMGHEEYRAWRKAQGASWAR